MRKKAFVENLKEMGTQPFDVDKSKTDTIMGYWEERDRSIEGTNNLSRKFGTRSWNEKLASQHGVLHKEAFTSTRALNKAIVSPEFQPGKPSKKDADFLRKARADRRRREGQSTTFGAVKDSLGANKGKIALGIGAIGAAGAARHMYKKRQLEQQGQNKMANDRAKGALGGAVIGSAGGAALGGSANVVRQALKNRKTQPHERKKLRDALISGGFKGGVAGGALGAVGGAAAGPTALKGGREAWSNARTKLDERTAQGKQQLHDAVHGNIHDAAKAATKGGTSGIIEGAGKSTRAETGKTVKAIFGALKRGKA